MTISLSASASVVDVALVEPSTMLSSAPVDVIAVPPKVIFDVVSVVIVCEVVVPPTTPLIVGAVSVLSVRVWAPASPSLRKC